MNRNELLFLVLSYNGFEDTVACIDSLLPQLQDPSQLMVVDNASQGGIALLLKARFPDIEVIALDENQGWAGGNNVGLRLMLERGYRWVCLLNNDTVMRHDTVARMMDRIEALPPAMLHPKIFYWDEPEVAQLDPAPLPGPEGIPLHWNGVQVMNYAYGACLLVHRTVFEQAGLFDERFFLQLEETDFYHRAAALGFPAVFDPTICMWHKESIAFGGKVAPIKTYYSVRNQLLLLEKRRLKLRERLFELKKIRWALHHLARNPQLGLQGRPSVLHLVFSKGPYGRAIRQAVTDYALRRFGRLRDDRAAQIQRTGS